MQMKLTDLDGSFLREEKRSDGRYLVPVPGVAGAGHISFNCPCGNSDCTYLCLRINGAPPTHGFTGRDPEWTATGTDINDVTLSPSVLRRHGCKSHFFVRNGQIEMC